jgi:hypothetical protein
MPQEIKVELIKTGADRQEERRKALIDRTVALVAVISAIAAIGSAYAAHKDAEKSLQAQIKSVNDQLLVQQASVLPYVVAEPILDDKGYAITETLPHPSPGFPSTIVRFLVSARGQTPAIAVAPHVECANVPPQPFMDNLLKAAPLQQDVSIAILGSSDKHTVKCPFMGDATIVGVRVSYSDVFSNQHQIVYFFKERLSGDKIFVYLIEPPNITVKYAPRR